MGHRIKTWARQTKHADAVRWFLSKLEAETRADASSRFAVDGADGTFRPVVQLGGGRQLHPMPWGELVAGDMTAMSLSDTSPGGLTAWGGPGLGAFDLRSRRAGPNNLASIAWGAGIATVFIEVFSRLLGPKKAQAALPW